MNYVLSVGFQLLDRGFIPDVVTRFFIRRMLYTERLCLVPSSVQSIQAQEEAFIADLRSMKRIAMQTERANAQHYEVPAEFFLTVLGPRLKYSACEFGEGKTLAQAENDTFQLYGKRADLHDGMRVLDVGCGWGSLTLWLLETYPKMLVSCISNSESQKQFIEDKARKKGYFNRLTAIKCDINDFDMPENSFDRIMSLEMFEHCKGYEILFERLNRWL